MGETEKAIVAQARRVLATQGRRLSKVRHASGSFAGGYGPYMIIDTATKRVRSTRLRLDDLRAIVAEAKGAGGPRS